MSLMSNEWRGGWIEGSCRTLIRISRMNGIYIRILEIRIQSFGLLFNKKLYLSINRCSIILFFIGLFIKFIVNKSRFWTSITCFRCDLFVHTHTWNYPEFIFKKTSFLYLLACSISKFSIGLKWWIFSSGLVNGGDVIQLFVMGDCSIWIEIRFRENFHWKYLPVVETKTQLSSSTIASDEVVWILLVDDFDQNEVMALYML